VIDRLLAALYWRGPDAAKLQGYDAYHDLNVRTGFGDRLVEAWAALTVLELARPDARVAMHWDRLPSRTADRLYDPALFSIDGCDFVEAWPRLRARKRFDRAHLVERCFTPLPPRLERLRLRTEGHWGGSRPDRIHADLQHYGVPTSVSAAAVADVYRRVARGTQPSAAISSVLPADLGERVGLHIRRTDKLMAVERDIGMDPDSWRRIEARGLAHIDACVADGVRMFICSDDPAYRSELLAQIRRRGGDAIALDVAPDSRPDGFDALADFFALSRCREVVMMTKYSTFAVAAALIGATTLVHLLSEDDPVPSRLWAWRGTVPLRASPAVEAADAESPGNAPTTKIDSSPNLRHTADRTSRQTAPERAPRETVK